MQNLITRSLGVWDTVEPELGTPARSGDLLLGSDGFSRFVPAEKTLELVSESNDLQPCCESLIETAKRWEATITPHVFWADCDSMIGVS